MSRQTFPNTTPIWSRRLNPAAGDVSGPASSTPGHVVTFADGTGKLIADSGTPLSALATVASVTAAQLTADAAALRLTPQVVISASRALTDDDAGKILICDTSSGAIALTAPQTLAAEWNAMVIREGANAATITGTGTMVMVGPAATAGVVTIGVDDGGVTLVRRSASRCLAYGVVS